MEHSLPPSHPEVLYALLTSLIAEPENSPTLSGQTDTPLPGPVLTIPSDVILPLLDVFAPFAYLDSESNTASNQQKANPDPPSPLEATLRQVIAAADHVQGQEIAKDTPPGAKALAALRLVKTLVIQHIPANNHVTGLAAFANLVKSSHLPLGLSVHTIVIASEAVLEFGSQTTTKQPQSRAFLSVLAKVCSPKSLIVHMPLADYLPRRPHPDPHYWEAWEHERLIARFAISLKQSLQHLCVHNIVSQQPLPEVPTADCHYHFAQYPFVQPRISREMAHYGTPPLCRFDRHCQIWATLMNLVESYKDELSTISTGKEFESCERLNKPLGSCTFYNAEAMLCSVPHEDEWSLEKDVRWRVDRHLGEQCQPVLREKILAQIHFVAGDPTW